MKTYPTFYKHYINNTRHIRGRLTKYTEVMLHVFMLLPYNIYWLGFTIIWAYIAKLHLLILSAHVIPLFFSMVGHSAYLAVKTVFWLNVYHHPPKYMSAMLRPGSLFLRCVLNLPSLWACRASSILWMIRREMRHCHYRCDVNIVIIQREAIYINKTGFNKLNIKLVT